MIPDYEAENIVRIVDQFNWVFSQKTHRIGPRTMSAEVNRLHVLNILDLAGYNYERDTNWPHIPIYFLTKQQSS